MEPYLVIGLSGAFINISTALYMLYYVLRYNMLKYAELSTLLIVIGSLLLSVGYIMKCLNCH